MSAPLVAIPLIERIQERLATLFPQVQPDGDIGKVTRAALRALGNTQISGAFTLRCVIQGDLHQLFPNVQADGIFGPITFSAVALLDEMGDHESMAEMVAAGRLPATTGAIDHSAFSIVKASSFADPADVAAFRTCKARGGSDVRCFAQGDNGIGAWGQDTTADAPMVALPREVWRHAGKRGGDPVDVLPPGGDVPFRAILGDTMPSLENIKNGAGMDCNPAAVRQLGHTPPMMLEGVGWRWSLAGLR